MRAPIHASIAAALLLGAATSACDAAQSTSADTHADAQIDATVTQACNGHAALCGRRFDQVALAATHNAHAVEADGFLKIAMNQTRPFADQLTDGVRGFLLDV